MGAWGYKAYENDTAGDWMFRVFVDKIRKTVTSPKADTDETLAAVAVVLDLGLVPWFSKASLNDALDRVVANDAKCGAWSEEKHGRLRRRYLKRLRDRMDAVPSNAWSPMGLILHNVKPKAKRAVPARRPATTRPARWAE